MPFNALGLPLEYTSKEYRAQLTKANPIDNSIPLWTPKNPEDTAIARYRHHINQKFSQNLKTSHELHQWTVTHPHKFWIDLYSHCGIIPPLPRGTTQAYDPKIPMRDIPPFFPGHKLNYAENVLVPNASGYPNAVALVGIRENQLDNPEEVTWAELCELVRLTRSAMLRHGIKQNDVVAGLMANSIWIIVVFLATASMGAIFTSVSPDMGVGGCVSRFSQVAPKLLFTDTDFAVRGARPSMMGKIRDILNALQGKVRKPLVVFVPTTHTPHQKQNYEYITPLGLSLYEFLKKARSTDILTYTRVPTSHPLVILYSSGTTGQPKCIVSPHMSIINYKKIALLHNSLGPDSTVFQYSSTSWVVWNVMNGHLSVGAKTICYDGGALYPDPSTLLRICSQFKATYWGTSPRYLLELEQSGIKPKSFDLSSLRLITTTGATLTGEQMRWFYTTFPGDIQLSSIAGGTEIASSWIATDSSGPLYANEMQIWALGHACDILDSSTGASLAQTGQPGELVCRAPFPSMPSQFWGDKGHRRYREAYFEKFPLPSGGYLDVWAQHDFTVMNPLTHGLQITGRSDGVLNPSGIRFGSSEIYNIVEGPKFNTEIFDTLCVGRRRAGDVDEVVFLFVVMSSGHAFSDDLVARIKAAVRDALSARHVPKFIEPVSEIPYTINGKKVEVVVKKIISGAAVKVSSTVRNPACLDQYYRFKDLEREKRPRPRL